MKHVSRIHTAASLKERISVSWKYLLLFSPVDGQAMISFGNPQLSCVMLSSKSSFSSISIEMENQQESCLLHVDLELCSFWQVITEKISRSARANTP
jgi:hypothetical protein